MQQINNGFAEYYYITEKGEVINNNTNKILKSDSNCYSLLTINGKYKKISLKRLYKLVYNKVFCIDNIKDLDNEIWKEIKYTDGNYYVSNMGRIKSYTQYKAFIMQPCITNKGYYRLQIKQNGKIINKYIHRLVADAFLPMPASIEYCLHHKDFNKLNNKVDNLIWLSPKEHAKVHLNIKEK